MEDICETIHRKTAEEPHFSAVVWATLMWEIIGQERALAILGNGLERGNLAHAYLFLGPPRVGKMTLAVNLAQALNCSAAEPPCGQCPSCQRIKAGKHADVQVVGVLPDESGRLRAEIGIDQIRELGRLAYLKPYEGKCRVFIIDGAELMTAEAANCLLKTLEEPPTGVYLILLSTNESQLLPTLISRCQRIELRPLGEQPIAQALTERWKIAPDKARRLARLSQGCLGWAVTAATDEALIVARSQQVAQLLSLHQAGCTERFAFAATEATHYTQNPRSAQETLELWLGLWRDLLLIKGGRPELISNFDYQDKLSEQARNYDIAGIRRFIRSLHDTQQKLGQNANPRLVLEVLMLSLPEVAQHPVGLSVNERDS